jgi:hypothetical protein
MFGEDISSGCTLQLSFDDLKDSVGCVKFRQFVFDVQTGGGINLVNSGSGSSGGGNTLGVLGAGFQSGRLWKMDRVGRFGNANVTILSDWVSVIVKDVGDKVSNSLVTRVSNTYWWH